MKKITEITLVIILGLSLGFGFSQAFEWVSQNDFSFSEKNGKKWFIKSFLDTATTNSSDSSITIKKTLDKNQNQSLSENLEYLNTNKVNKPTSKCVGNDKAISWDGSKWVCRSI